MLRDQLAVKRDGLGQPPVVAQQGAMDVVAQDRVCLLYTSSAMGPEQARPAIPRLAE